MYAFSTRYQQEKKRAGLRIVIVRNRFSKELILSIETSTETDQPLFQSMSEMKLAYDLQANNHVIMQKFEEKKFMIQTLAGTN